MTTKKLGGAWPFVTVGMLAIACSGDAPRESLGENQEALTTVERVLGFEQVSGTPAQSDWVLAPGSSGALSSSTTRTEGAAAAQLANHGWAQLQSIRIGPVSSFRTSHGQRRDTIGALVRQRRPLRSNGVPKMTMELGANLGYARARRGDRVERREA